jgi:hypothetical protein
VGISVSKIVIIVAFRSAKGRGFRGAKDHPWDTPGGRPFGPVQRRLSPPAVPYIFASAADLNMIPVMPGLTDESLRWDKCRLAEGGFSCTVTHLPTGLFVCQQYDAQTVVWQLWQEMRSELEAKVAAAEKSSGPQ